MPVLRIDIERALDELVSQEEGMRFQGLAVVLGKQRWPELVAQQRKNDFGLDAYAPASDAPNGVGKGLAASITPRLEKVSADASKAKKNFHDVGALLFVTPHKVSNAEQRRWADEIGKDHGLELTVIEREEIIALMMMPENAPLCGSLLNLDIDAEPEVAELIARTKRATDEVVGNWASKTKGHPLIELTAVRLDPDGAESSETLPLAQIEMELSRNGRIVLEAPAGRGKTTTLVQLAQRVPAPYLPFIVELSSWTTSSLNILDHIGGIPAFRAQGVGPAELARVLRAAPCLFLLNGWNEIAESNSVRSHHTLRELERDFPGSGIIVATRTHHLMPPLGGALRLRLLRLAPVQRKAYLKDRLGANAAGLLARIDADPPLDGLTGTPFILSEVATLFQAGAEIPSTKFGVLTAVRQLHERRDEHRNPLQAAPVSGRQTDYLEALATEMTRRGTVALSEAETRAVFATVAKDLAADGQIEPVAAPAVIANLTAHHLLERVEHPETAFQFEHQQFQEYYAALEVRARLLDLPDHDPEAVARFTADYVNNPAWSEQLRLIADSLGDRSGEERTDERYLRSGVKLVRMALNVDPVFAGELARLCGAAVWNEVRAEAENRFRAVHALPDENYQDLAITAMVASGAGDFQDIILPLMSDPDRRTRRSVYWSWADFHLSSLGPDWRQRVSGWSEEARADFVSELLYQRVDGEIAAFAVADDGAAVKKAAVSALMWTGSDDALTSVLESMDALTFNEIALRHFKDMPPALRPRAVAAARDFVESDTDRSIRLKTAISLIEFGESGLEGALKDMMATLPVGYPPLPMRHMAKLDLRSVRPVLEFLHGADPVWVSEWAAVRIADGAVNGHEEWLPFLTDIPDGLVERYLHRIETEDVTHSPHEGMIQIIATRADTRLAVRLFKRLRELRRRVDSEPGDRLVWEPAPVRQVKDTFCALPDEIGVAGILSSVTNSNPLDIKVATYLLGGTSWFDLEPLDIADADLRARLRAYLMDNVELVLGKPDFDGREKGYLASSIARVGEAGDTGVLVSLIRADIDRFRRARAAWAAGDRGPLGDGGRVICAQGHVANLVHLAPAGVEQVLIDLLREPEYASSAAWAIAGDFAPKPDHAVIRKFPYDLMWAAREGRSPPPVDDRRRARFAAALNAEIERLRNEVGAGTAAPDLMELARALATIDGRASAHQVLDAISQPGEWNDRTRLDTVERLAVAGAILPAAAVFSLVDSILEGGKSWVLDTYPSVRCRAVALCAFVDDPLAGISKMREALGKARLGERELAEIVTALGESRSDAAVDLLRELACDPPTFEHCAESFYNAAATLDTPRARELLVGFVDPDCQAILQTRPSHRDDVLVARLTELARRGPDVAKRFRELCERDLPEANRQLLSKVVGSLGTRESLIANLNLIDDAKTAPVPDGVRNQLESAFVERRTSGSNSYILTRQARSSNDVRVRLFRMARGDSKRRRSASMLLGEIEQWRLQHGRPTDEPRHPDLEYGGFWPPLES